MWAVTWECFDVSVCIWGIYIYICTRADYTRSVHDSTYICVPYTYIHAHYFKVFWCARVHMRHICLYILTHTLQTQCTYLYIYMYTEYLHTRTLLQSFLMCACAYAAYALCLDGVYVGVCVWCDIFTCVGSHVLMCVKRKVFWRCMCVCLWCVYMYIYVHAHTLGQYKTADEKL